MFSQQLDKFTDQYCASTGFTGYLQITKKDELIYRKSIGYQDPETKRPFTENSMFTLYSLSKPFCAIGLMKLYDKGLIDIDAHPSKYLPEAKVLDKSLKLRQVMQHVSGIPDFHMEEEFKDLDGSEKTIRENLPRLFEKPMYFAPGTAAKYANINYNIMALIIQNVTGISYSEYMQKEVFEPLEMKNAIIDKDGLYIPDRVQGYYKDDAGNIIACERNPAWMFGAGDIVATALDVYRLNHAVKKGLLLSEDSWKQVLSPSPHNNMGFGCTVKRFDGKTRLTHNGGHTGFRTYHIHLLEDDFDVILLSNSGWGLGRNEIETQIYNIFYGYDLTKGVMTPMDTGYI